MRTFLRYTTIITLVGTSFFYTSCKKDIVDRTTQYPALAPSNIDLNADSWKAVLITDPTVFNVPAPAATTSRHSQR